MGYITKAVVAAGVVAAVQGLKDQGGIRYRSALRISLQEAERNRGSFSQLRTSSATIGSSPSSLMGEKRGGEAEESLRKVMYLICWGPN